MSAESRNRTLALISPTTSFDGFAEVDIVVEAVYENLALKQETFAALCRSDACRLHPGIEYLDAGHRRSSRRQWPAGSRRSGITSSARQTS